MEEPEAQALDPATTEAAPEAEVAAAAEAAAAGEQPQEVPVQSQPAPTAGEGGELPPPPELEPRAASSKNLRAGEEPGEPEKT